MEKSPNIVESHHIVKIDAKPQVVLLIAPGLVVVESRLHSRLQKIDVKGEAMMTMMVMMTTIGSPELWQRLERRGCEWRWRPSGWTTCTSQRFLRSARPA